MNRTNTDRLLHRANIMMLLIFHQEELISKQGATIDRECRLIDLREAHREIMQQLHFSLDNYVSNTSSCRIEGQEGPNGA